MEEVGVELGLQRDQLRLLLVRAERDRLLDRLVELQPHVAEREPQRVELAEVGPGNALGHLVQVVQLEGLDLRVQRLDGHGDAAGDEIGCGERAENGRQGQERYPRRVLQDARRQAGGRLAEDQGPAGVLRDGGRVYLRVALARQDARRHAPRCRPARRGSRKSATVRSDGRRRGRGGRRPESSTKIEAEEPPIMSSSANSASQYCMTSTIPRVDSRGSSNERRQGNVLLVLDHDRGLLLQRVHVRREDQPVAVPPHDLGIPGLEPRVSLDEAAEESGPDHLAPRVEDIHLRGRLVGAEYGVADLDQGLRSSRAWRSSRRTVSGERGRARCLE